MSIGIGAHANLVFEDEQTVIYEYGGYNLDDSKYRNENHLYDGSVCVGGIDKRQLNKEHIEDFPIICPTEDMVNKYIAFVDQVDKSKVAVQKALDETQMLFDSLMQKYFA